MLDLHLKTKLAIEENLNTLIKPKHDHLVYDAARYLLLQEGKRLRPLLLLSVLIDYEIPFEKGLEAACALEMIHTYSLIHDDLPSMDNDDYRRGVLTVHKKFGENIAILAGDFLLTYPFEILSSINSLSDHQKCALIKLLSKHAGAEGMIEGQMLDIQGLSLYSPDELKTIYEKKTSQLFIAALSMGGIISDASSEDLALLNKIGTSFGLAYQYLDDLDDSTQDQLKGFSHSQELEFLISQHLNDCLNYIKKLSKPCQFLYHLALHPFTNKDKILKERSLCLHTTSSKEHSI